jgi:hypothetical protein
MAASPKIRASLIALTVAIFSACSGQTRVFHGSAEPVLVSPSPPATSPLAKVKLGMNYKQVREILGSPSDENSYPTGKAFIPFYFGNDARRTTWCYKGEGRVLFSGGNVFGGQGNGEVIRVEYDPSETGIAPR